MVAVFCSRVRRREHTIEDHVPRVVVSDSGGFLQQGMMLVKWMSAGAAMATALHLAPESWCDGKDRRRLRVSTHFKRRGVRVAAFANIPVSSESSSVIRRFLNRQGVNAVLQRVKNDSRCDSSAAPDE